jgi:hypothetical protein
MKKITILLLLLAFLCVGVRFNPVAADNGEYNYKKGKSILNKRNLPAFTGDYKVHKWKARKTPKYKHAKPFTKRGEEVSSLINF